MTLLSTPAFATSITDFALLEGCWRGPVQGGDLQEAYSAPTAKMIFGHDQVISPSGETLGWGSMALVETGSDLTFRFSENGAQAWIYKLVDYQAAPQSFSATFSNPQVPAGTTVVLTVEKNQVLKIRIEGMSGNPNGYELVMNRTGSSADCSANSLGH